MCQIILFIRVHPSVVIPRQAETETDLGLLEVSHLFCHWRGSAAFPEAIITRHIGLSGPDKDVDELLTSHDAWSASDDCHGILGAAGRPSDGHPYPVIFPLAPLLLLMR